MKTPQLKPDFAFSPSLLDGYQRMIDTSAEDFFYQDETGWHKNWNEEEETLRYSEEEVDAMLKQEFIDRVNKVPEPPSEAADKGTVFNEIVDCLILNRKPVNPDITIKTIRRAEDLYGVRSEERQEESYSDFAKVGMPFIYASLNGFEFFFDKRLCIETADYFVGSIAQYYTKANIETAMGTVELHGYIDYLRQNRVYDLKTTKSYAFGNYQKRWQRYVYPYTLIQSGMMNEVQSFEFTVFVLKGGTSRTPIITGTPYKEVYTYDHEQARQILAQQCERVAEFLEENRELITNKKVFGQTE